MCLLNSECFLFLNNALMQLASLSYIDLVVQGWVLDFLISLACGTSKFRVFCFHFQCAQAVASFWRWCISIVQRPVLDFLYILSPFSRGAYQNLYIPLRAFSIHSFPRSSALSLLRLSYVKVDNKTNRIPPVLQFFFLAWLLSNQVLSNSFTANTSYFTSTSHQAYPSSLITTSLSIYFYFSTSRALLRNVSPQSCTRPSITTIVDARHLDAAAQGRRPRC